jgi:hypothetical protein
MGCGCVPGHVLDGSLRLLWSASVGELDIAEFNDESWHLPEKSLQQANTAEVNYK